MCAVAGMGHTMNWMENRTIKSGSVKAQTCMWEEVWVGHRPKSAQRRQWLVLGELRVGPIVQQTLTNSWFGALSFPFFIPRAVLQMVERGQSSLALDKNHFLWLAQSPNLTDNYCMRSMPTHVTIPMMRSITDWLAVFRLLFICYRFTWYWLIPTDSAGIVLNEVLPISWTVRSIADRRVPFTRNKVLTRPLPVQVVGQPTEN